MEFDLLIIGSGPAGQRAALQGAKEGKKVAIVERYSSVGGNCVHVGTLPSKSLRESIYRWSMGSRGTLGVELGGVDGEQPVQLPDLGRLMLRKARVVNMEAQIIFDQLKRNNIRTIRGEAEFISPNELKVVSNNGEQRITAKYIFIAVGARPVAPAHLQVDGISVLDSNTILKLKRVPRTMVVLGAGVIGCEYASMFGVAGTQVHLVDKRHEILKSVDRTIVNRLVERFTHQHMEFILETEATRIEREVTENAKGEAETRVRVFLANGRMIEADVALVAMGRMGNTRGLHLERVGVKVNDNWLVEVDRSYRTSVPNVYAVGDVIGAPALASTSMEQGRIACCHAFGIGGLTASEMPEHFPYGIYTIPEISTVGKAEEQCKAEGIPYIAGHANYREIARGQIVGDRWGMLKLIIHRDSLKVLGVHIIGDNAAELIHIGQACMTLDGDVNFFIKNVFNYPTFAEAYKTAAFHAVNLKHGKTRTHV